MGKKIYVGNMNFRTTEDSLRSLFGQYGEVASVNIVLDKETGRPKGFGFVEMAADEDADKAIADLDGKPFDGRPLRVNEALSKPRPAGNGGGRFRQDM